MTKILSTIQFNTRGKDTLKDLFNGTDPFIYVANETHPDRSLIVLSPQAFATLLRTSGFDSLANDVENIKYAVRQKFRIKSGAYRTTKVAQIHD